LAGTLLCKTPSCCRRTNFSASNVVLDFIKPRRKAVKSFKPLIVKDDHNTILSISSSDEVFDRHRAMICSLIETAKLNHVEPYEWLKDILDKMVNGHPNNRLDDLLPRNWTP